MDYLRVTLIIIGVVVVATIIVIDRLRKERIKAKFNHKDDPLLHDDNDPLFATRDEPLDVDAIDSLKSDENLSTDDNIDPLEDEINPEPSSDIQQNDTDDYDNEPEMAEEVIEDEPEDHEETDSESAIEPQVLSLAVIASKESPIEGKTLRELMEESGFVFGDMDIFHRMYQGKAIISIANIQEPGSFDINNLDHFSTPGVMAFLQLPTVIDGTEAVEELISVCERIADRVSGKIITREREPLDDSIKASMRSVGENFSGIND